MAERLVPMLHWPLLQHYIELVRTASLNLIKFKCHVTESTGSVHCGDGSMSCLSVMTYALYAVMCVAYTAVARCTYLTEIAHYNSMNQ